MRLALLIWSLGGAFLSVILMKLVIYVYIGLGIVDESVLSEGVNGTPALTPSMIAVVIGLVIWIGGVVYLINRVKRL